VVRARLGRRCGGGVAGAAGDRARVTHPMTASASWRCQAVVVGPSRPHHHLIGTRGPVLRDPRRDRIEVAPRR
jgi:hypothetical protein